MDATDSQRQKRRDDALSLLDVAIEAMNLAKEISSITPAVAVFGSVSVLLTMIRDSMVNKSDYVDLGLACADVCRALDRGMGGKRVDELSRSVFEAIGQLTTAVAEIQKNIIKRGKRNGVSRMFHSKNDKEAIAAWRSDLNRILHVFNTELAIITNGAVSDVHRDVLTIQTVVSDVRHDITNIHTVVSDAQTIVANVHHDVANTHTVVSDTHVIVSELQRNVTNTQTIVSDIHRTIMEGQEGTDGKNRSTQPSAFGESPPPAGACFGREDLIEKVVDFAEHLTSIALIGAGGIGKTSVALTVLHHDRIKERFGANRRFIRCDQFPASRTHFLSRLSKVIGAGVENPEDLTPLRPFLSSRELILVLDNAESILDPQGTGARDIYTVVEELSRFDTVCLCITSRISTVPRHCKRPVIPTLSMESACDIFYGIYDNGGRSDIISNLLRRLDFHALSITLLATTASYNMWDYDRLAREWDTRRTKVLQTDYDESLAATIELSLASPTFCKLGPDARELLGVVAFFPQGINETNVNWLFPTIPNRESILDKLCALSLTYRSNGFVAMLAPLRDYLCPADPTSSPLIQTTKESYFARLSADIYPSDPGFEEAQWILSEDVNVEHLLGVFTLIDASSTGLWNACTGFMRHIYWCKPRLVALGPNIEALPDDHPFKADCLYWLSSLFDSVGNHVECKRLLIHILKLWREEGSELEVAQTLRNLSDANRMLGLYEEGVDQAKEASEIFERLNDVLGQGRSLVRLAWLLLDTEQLGDAEEATSRAINLFPGKGEEFMVAQCHRLLGNIYRSKGETGMAIEHLETALRIASPLNLHNELFWIYYSLGESFSGENRFDDAGTQIEHAKLHAIDDIYNLGRAMELQARVWYKEGRFEEAKSEALCATDTYKRIGATKDVEACGQIIRDIEEQMEEPVSSGE